MVRHQVYAIWSSPIFRDALRVLLSHPEIHWIGDGADIEQAVAEILHLRPGTVLLETSPEANPGKLIELLDEKDFQLQIISLNINTNEAILYHRDYRTVVHDDDLLHYILTPFVFGGIHDD